MLLIGRWRIIIVANSLLLSFGFFETFLDVIMAQAGLEFYSVSTSASSVEMTPEWTLLFYSRLLLKHWSAGYKQQKLSRIILVSNLNSIFRDTISFLFAALGYTCCS